MGAYVFTGLQVDGILVNLEGLGEIRQCFCG